MTVEEEGDDTIEGIADKVLVRAQELRDGQARLERIENRNNFLIKVLGLSVAFDILLSILLGGVVFRVRTTAHKASVATSLARTNAQAEKITCESGNDARALNNKLWTYVLGVTIASPHPNLTSQQIQAEQQQIAQFKIFIQKTFAPKQC